MGTLAPADYGDLRSDWAAFFELFSNVRPPQLPPLRRPRPVPQPRPGRQPPAAPPHPKSPPLPLQERGVKLRLNLPDTLVLRHGQPVTWFATNKACCRGQQWPLLVMLSLPLLAAPGLLWLACCAWPAAAGLLRLACWLSHRCTCLL